MWASWCLVACFVSQAAFADTSDKGANNDESALAWAWWYVSEASEAILAQKQSIKPKPVRVDWRASRLGELDGVYDVLDMASFDFDGDGVDSILVLTPSEVLHLSIGPADVSVASRAPWPGPSAKVRSRVPVGTFIRNNEGLWAVSSDKDAKVEIHVDEDGVRVAKAADIPPLCGALHLERRPGTHLYSLAESTWIGDAIFETKRELPGVRCSDRDSDKEGRLRKVFSAVDVNGEFHLGCRVGVDGCDLEGMDLSVLGKVGYALSVGDVDRDGWPELATTKTSLPTFRDRASVWTTKDGVLKRVHSRAFDKGVALLTMVDIDGDHHLEVVAFVRSKKGSVLWAVNQ